MTKQESIEWLKRCLSDAKKTGSTKIVFYPSEIEALIRNLTGENY